MSCHAIGHGINAVMEVVLDLYEEGEVTAVSSDLRWIGRKATAS